VTLPQLVGDRFPDTSERNEFPPNATTSVPVRPSISGQRTIFSNKRSPGVPPHGLLSNRCRIDRTIDCHAYFELLYLRVDFCLAGGDLTLSGSTQRQHVICFASEPTTTTGCPRPIPRVQGQTTSSRYRFGRQRGQWLRLTHYQPEDPPGTPFDLESMTPVNDGCRLRREVIPGRSQFDKRDIGHDADDFHSFR